MYKNIKQIFCVLMADDRQEYDVREERRRELEFLEKVSLSDILLHCFAAWSLYNDLSPSVEK